MPEIHEPRPDTLRRPVVEAVLELLDLGVHRVERLEERLRDLVDESIDELAGIGLLVDGRVERRHVEGLTAASWCLPDGDDDTGSRDEVDFQVAHAILVGKRARGDEDAEDVRAVALEQWARLPTVHRPRDERLDDLGVDLDRQASRAAPRGWGRRDRASVRSLRARVVRGAVGDACAARQ